MDHKQRRKVLSGAVIISSFIIAVVCLAIIANAMPDTVTGPTEGPSSSITPGNSQPAATPENQTSFSAGTTSDRTPTMTYDNSTYSTNEFNTSKPSNSLSIATETPVVTPDRSDAKLNRCNVGLVSFDGTTAEYEITMNFSKAGNAKIVAVNSDRQFTDSDGSPDFIRNVISTGDVTYISTNQAYASKNVTANTDYKFRIVTTHEKFDLFICLDGSSPEEYMEKSIVIRDMGGICKIISHSTPEIDTDGRLNFTVTASGHTQIVVKFIRDGVVVRNHTAETVSNTAQFSIEDGSIYTDCSIEAYIMVNNIVGSERYLISTPVGF